MPSQRLRINRKNTELTKVALGLPFEVLGPMLDVGALAVSATSIRLSDSRPAGTLPLRGVLRRRDDPTGTLGGAFQIEDAPATTARTFSGLVPNTLYTVSSAPVGMDGVVGPVTVVTARTPQALVLSTRPKIGVYRSYQTSATLLAAYEAFLKRRVDYVLEFQGTEAQGNLGWPNYMRSHYNPTYMATRKLMLGASLSPTKLNSGNYYDRVQTWQQLADGLFVATWQAMGNNLIADGLGSSVLRGAHEFNEPMFAHRVYPGEEAAFIAAWRLWHTTLKALPGASFHFNWNPTTGDYNGNNLDTVACWPGDAYVDTVDLDLYDRWYSRGATPAAPRTLTEQQSKWQQMLTMDAATWRGLNYWRAFAVARGKGMGFSEWGTGSYFNQTDGNHGGGDNPVFMTGMADFILDPAYPPGAPGGVVDHAMWEDGNTGIVPLDAANPDLGRAIPTPKMRAIFLERFAGAA